MIFRYCHSLIGWSTSITIDLKKERTVQLKLKCIIIQNDQSNKYTTLCVQFIIQSRIEVHI